MFIQATAESAVQFPSRVLYAFGISLTMESSLSKKYTQWTFVFEASTRDRGRLLLSEIERDSNFVRRAPAVARDKRPGQPGAPTMATVFPANQAIVVGGGLAGITAANT